MFKIGRAQKLYRTILLIAYRSNISMISFMKAFKVIVHRIAIHRVGVYLTQGVEVACR